MQYTVADKRKFNIGRLWILVVFYYVDDSHLCCGTYYSYSLFLLDIDPFCKLMVSFYISHIINFS